ncbi:MAG: efflux RND transporter permease subunit [Planctomycetaceae bacterium]|nr:efflux RND transporter permease subunit [Planctomycetaceae bacterium]
MTIWELCIKRPIFTVMLVSAPIVLGLASYPRLGVDLFPNVDLPLVTVTTTLRGASVEEMETGVTKPIEEIVNTVSGIEQLRSTTKEGISQVMIEFVLDKDGAVAAQEVDAKVRTILSQLPAGTDAPIIDKFALDAAPVMTIAVSGRRDAREITEIAKRRIKEDLESLPGVGAVILVGGRQRAVQISIDTDKLKKFENLTIEDVRQALVRENQEQPGGRIDQGTREIVLRTMGRVRDPLAFADLIVANRNGQPVRLRDLGTVSDSFEEPRGISRLWSAANSTANESHDAASVAELARVREPSDTAKTRTLASSATLPMTDAPGDQAVTLIVQKQSGTNTVAIVDHVKRRLAELRELLPADIDVAVIRDQSKFIENSIHEVQTHLLLAAVLVSLTILLFIRDWRTTIIATLSIPTSMIATFAFMYVMGFTLNNITMLGLILAIGIVVDDAVVVHENIFRHMEEYGLSAWQAAASATKEIALAVVATTFSLLVIFVPVVFMGGRVGRFFSSFGYVVGFSILMSMFISFTMTPMLCARFLKAEEGHSSKAGWIWRLVEGFYMGSLRFSLQHRWLIVLLTIGMLASTPQLMSIVGKDFVPRDDTSEFEVAVTLPEGYTLDRADEVLTEVELRLRKLRGVTNTFITIGDTTGRATRGQGEVTRATIYCRLSDLKDREFSQFDVMADARGIVVDYPDLRAAVQDVAAISGSGFRQVMIDLNLRGPDMQRLQEFSEQITNWMKSHKHYVDVDTSLSFRKPELRILPLRERASELGVSIQSISTTANVLVGGEPVSKYKEADQQYDVWLRAERGFRDDPNEIARLTVPSSKPGVGVVELGNVARFEEAQGPATIERFARQRQVVVSANLEGKPLGEGVQELADFVKTLDLPADYRWEFIGQAKNLNDTMANFLIAFGLAFLFMYMILAAQFESFVHPITILLALPLTVPFAILSLILLRTNLDIYAMFGLFMLFGIVKKNGILQVDYTNVLRERGLPRDQAILDANAVRLRPILMTTVMLVAAMVPMAVGEGPGAASRAGMAKVILGGQLLSLLLTLLLTPVAYSLWDDLTTIVRRWGTRLGWIVDHTDELAHLAIASIEATPIVHDKAA